MVVNKPKQSGLPQARKWWALKRVWTILTVLFLAAYLGVLRYGSRIGVRLKSHHTPAAPTSSAKAASMKGEGAGLGAGYARIASEGRAGMVAKDSKGGAYANDVNDLGLCPIPGVEGDATTAAPTPPPAPSPKHLGGAGKRKSARESAYNASSDPTLASPLCQEILATEPWLSASRRREGGGAGGGVSVSNSGGGSGRGEKGGSSGSGNRLKSDVSPGAKLWSAPVCGFIARELQAASSATSGSSSSIGSGSSSSSGGGGEKDGSGRVLSSGDQVSEGGMPLGKGYIVACGGVRITGGDVGRMCGAAPEDWESVPKARVTNPYSRNASHTFFMWNKALAAACDASPDPMIDDGPTLPLGDYTGPVSAGARTFYVVTTQLLQFIEQVVPTLSAPFVVVSGSSDVSGPLEGMGWSDHTLARVNALLAQPLCVALFAQNPDLKHPKVVPIHIGFDFHTIGRPSLPDAQDGHEWGQPLSVAAQDAQLTSLRCSLPPFSSRPLMALMNFKSSGRSIRSQVYNTLAAVPGVASIDRISRSDLWKRYGEFSFVVSPRGYGKDCHRTWEALALGCAVIVSRDAFMAPLYEDLPVVQVVDWREVTLENMGKWKAELAARWHTFRFEKLRTDFWLEAINAAAAQGSLEGIWKYTFDTREGRGNYSRGQLVWGRRGGTVDPPWQYWG